MQAEAASGKATAAQGARRDWRAVTVDRYRLWTTISSIAGVVLLAMGIWQLAHARFVSGPFLVVLGFAAGLWTGLLRIDGAPAPLYRERAQRERWSPRVLHYYTRQHCSLCEEAKARLVPALATREISFVEHDVDRDAALRERYGDRVPVAVYEGVEVFALEFDEDAVRALR